MENHGRVLAPVSPGPGFGYVIGIFEADHHTVLVPNGRIGQITRASKLEIEYLRLAAGRKRPHSLLIVGGAVMGELNSVPVNAVQGKHFLHA